MCCACGPSERLDAPSICRGRFITLIRDNITFTTTDIHLTINTHSTELQMVKVHINNTHSSNYMVKTCFDHAMRNANSPIGYNLAFIRNTYGYTVIEHTLVSSKRHSIQAVELSRRTQADVQNSRPPAMGARFTVFLACRQCGPAGCWRCYSQKRVMSRPIQTTLNKQVWICDICHKQIHV